MEGLVAIFTIACWFGLMLLLVWPYAIIAQRVGITRWFAVSQLFPIINLIALWYLALTIWRIDADHHKVVVVSNTKQEK